MKQIIYSLMALFAIIATSCNNDDIIIEKTGKLHTLTYTVSTQSMYDDFKMTETVREMLREGSYSLGVMTYLYDSNGNLVESRTSHSQTYNSITETFENLVEDEYTIVSVETLLDPDNDYKAEDWEIADEDKLSTLKINQIYSDAYYLSALGTCYSNVNLLNDASVSSKIEAIGSIFQLKFYNYDESDYPQVAFGSNDIIESYLLNPSLSRDDRFVTSLTSVGIFNARGTASVNDSQEFGFTLYILESKVNWKFYVKDPEDVGTNYWTYWDSTTGNTQLQDGSIYFGGSYFINSNTIPQCYIGDSEGYNNWLTNMEQIVSEQNSSLVPDLYLTWGGTVLSAQNMMSGYNMTLGSNGEAILQEDGSYSISYDGKGQVSQIFYYFTSATTGLFECDVQYDKSSVTSTEILNYLNGNYMYVYDMDDIYMYYTYDFSTIVMFFEIEGVYNIGFVDANYIYGSDVVSNTRAIDSINYPEIVDIIMKRQILKAPRSTNHSYKINGEIENNTISKAHTFLENIR